MRRFHTQYKVSCSILSRKSWQIWHFSFLQANTVNYHTTHSNCYIRSAAINKTVIWCLDRKSSSMVVGPSKRSSGTLLPLNSANVNALCLVPASAGAGPRLAPHALGLWKLPHVHMLRMVQAPTPIFHHLPAPCIYTQRQGLRWIATATLHLVGAEKFQMLTCSLQEWRVIRNRYAKETGELLLRGWAWIYLYHFIFFPFFLFPAQSFPLSYLYSMLPCFFPLLLFSFSSSAFPCLPLFIYPSFSVLPPCSVLQMAARQTVCLRRKQIWMKNGDKRWNKEAVKGASHKEK